MKPPAFWPTPDGERVAELFAYLSHAAPAAVDAARAYLAIRYPGATPTVYALPREQLADLVLDRHMTGVSVGSVSARTPQDGFCVVSIILMRSGQMAIGYDDEARRATTVVVG